MNLYFIFVQIIGFIAWILLGLSYYRKDTDRILAFQVIANILFCLHYLLLSAYSGLLICVFELVRDYLYYKTDKDNYIFIISIIVYIISSILTYTALLDVFPYVASTLDGFFLTKKKKMVVFGAIITYILWLIYDIYVVSWSGAITDGIIIISNLSILLFNIDLFDNDIVRRTFDKREN